MTDKKKALVKLSLVKGSEEILVRKQVLTSLFWHSSSCLCSTEQT